MVGAVVSLIRGFQSRPPFRKGAAFAPWDRRGEAVSIHAPEKESGDNAESRSETLMDEFQSTPPKRGERATHLGIDLSAASVPVSIHPRSEGRRARCR